MHTPLYALLDEKGHTVHSILPKCTIYECAQKLDKLKVGALLVMEDSQLLGIITERDILRKLMSRGDDPKKVLVSDIMTKELVTVLPSTTVNEATRTVTERRFRHLPVVENGKLVGLISIGDLTRWAMLSQERLIAALTHYIQGDR